MGIPCHGTLAVLHLINLVLLKTGIVHHPPGQNGEWPVTIDHNQMATAQKLLLFWRKPAVSWFQACIEHPYSHIVRSGSAGGMALKLISRSLESRLFL